MYNFWRNTVLAPWVQFYPSCLLVLLCLVAASGPHSPRSVCMSVSPCVCVCACLSAGAKLRTGAPLPRQHFLVINDFFLPPLLSLSLSLTLSLSFSFPLTFIVGMVEIDDIWAFAFSVTWGQSVEWERIKWRRLKTRKGAVGEQKKENSFVVVAKVSLSWF